MSFGERVERREDRRLLTGNGRYTDDFAPHAAHAAFVRSDYAHARIVDIDVSGALAVDGVHAVYTHEDLDGPVRGPAAADHPARGDRRPPHAVRARQGRGPPHRRDRRHGRGRGPLRRRGRRRRHPRRVRAAARRGRPRARRRAGRAAGARRPARQRDGPRLRGARRRRRRDWPRRTTCSRWHFDIERSASMPLEARAIVARFDDEGGLLMHDSTQAPTGVRAGLGLLFDLSLEKVQVVAPDVGGGFGVKVIQFYPEEVLVPFAAHRLGMAVKWTEDRREHFIGSTQERRQIHDVTVGLQRRRPHPRPRDELPARQRRLLPVRADHPDHHRRPAPRPVQARELPVRLHGAVHQHRADLALPRRRPAARGVRDGARDGSRRRRARPRPRRDPPPQPDPARRVPVRRRRHVPGRRADRLRLGRLPGRASSCSCARSATTGSKRGSRRPRPRAGRSASASPATSRAPASARTRAPRSTSRSTAR